MKKIIYLILLILWMLFIFILSNQNGNISGKLSSGLLYNVINFIYSIFNLSKNNINQVIELLHNPIRECAHSFEYFILGLLVFKNLENLNIKKIYIITLVFCFVCAVFDEIHQLFVIERTFQYYDILMDMLGCILMILLIKIYKNVKVGIKN